MSSGIFPLDCKGEFGSKLTAAVNLISEVEDAAYEWARDDDQFDNAASDGAARAMLRLAMELVTRQISMPPEGGEV